MRQAQLDAGQAGRHSGADRPTGSGKTTTLFLLAKLNVESVNIMTLRGSGRVSGSDDAPDLGERNGKDGFRNGIARSCARPDIILVGEIRDRDTAEMAFGSNDRPQVFTTLHTNIGVGDFPAPARHRHRAGHHGCNIIGIIAQRLVRFCASIARKLTRRPRKNDCCSAGYRCRFSRSFAGGLSPLQSPGYRAAPQSWKSAHGQRSGTNWSRAGLTRELREGGQYQEFPLAR